MNTTIRWSLALLLVVTAAGASPAQEEEEEKKRQAALEASMQKVIDAQERSRRATMTTSMEIRVDEFVRVCDLSDEQTRKLEVAAKGAVSRSLQTWRTNMVEMMKRRAKARGAAGVRPAIRLQPAVKRPVAEDVADRKKIADKNKDAVKNKAVDQARPAAPRAIGARAAVLAPGLANRRTVAAGQPYDERIWVKTVDSTITEEQKAKYKKHLAERRTFKRAAQVQLFVSNLDQQLFLSPEQRQQLTTLVDQTLGESFETGLRVQRQTLPAGKMKPILSEKQFEVWNARQPNRRIPVYEVVAV